jgi:asparagine synthase (glutamine-hydrolysing)
MCGIAGIFRIRGFASQVDQCAVERMIAAQAHRGPDNSGIHMDNTCVLGHRRLSILDLSSGGHQPMSNEKGTIWVTYNGEIYNCMELRKDLRSREHCFLSSCDTEVLIHGYEEWGIERLLSKLRGMFAFGLYDSRNARLVLARDRFGIKPLYYTTSVDGSALAFASEVRALRTGELRSDGVDRIALAGFLLFGSVPSPRTINEGIQCLPPAHYLVQSPGQQQLKRYWDLPEEERREQEDGPEVAASIGETIRQAVTGHLLSDVPVGVFLSGGMDSASIVALASRTSSRLTTLTISFAEHQYDESANARSVAERFVTEHQDIRVSGADFMRDVPAILAAVDQPTNDGVNTYYVSRAARQIGLKVVLSGLGGDEVFWGYRHYRWMEGSRAWLRRLLDLPPIARHVALLAASAYGCLSGQERWNRLQYLRNHASHAGLYFATRGFLPLSQVSRLTGFSPAEVNAIVESTLADDLPLEGALTDNLAAAFNRLELKRYLHDQLLRDADVFSMAHSIETRVPFLDHEVVSQVARVAGSRKVAAGTNKPMLLAAVNDSAVTAAANNKKKGFTFPIRDWMLANLSSLREIAAQSDQLDGKETRSMLDNFRTGRLHWSRAWSLVVLGGVSR